MKQTRMKMRMEAWGQDKKGEVLSKVRAKHQDRWMDRMAEIGRPITDPADIDYTD